MNEGRHEGRCAVVSGAGRGAGRIGAGIARRLAEGGARLVVADIDARVAETAEEIADVTRREIAAFVGDLALEATVVEMVKLAIERFGRIHILVNNAGGGIIRPFLDHTAETLRETIERNLWTTG